MMLAMIDEITLHLELMGSVLYKTGDILNQLDEYCPEGNNLMVKGMFLTELSQRISSGRYDITSVERLILEEEVNRLERAATGLKNIILSNTKNIDD